MANVDWIWIQTPVGGHWVRPEVGLAYNDLWRGWTAIEKQLHDVLPRRMAKARVFRLRQRDAVKP